jgi:ectoine hydroxylase-related dioxygenase (phytanoyl-CoA dioxygenase family)
MSMTVDPSLLAKFDQDGFVIIPQVIAREEVLALRPMLQKAIDTELARWSDNPNYIDHWMVHNLMMHGEPFLRFLEHPTMHSYLSSILGDTCTVYAYTSSSMPPRGTNYSRRVHVDCPRVIPGYVTNLGWLLALDDFTEENGATYCLPGSQMRLDTPSDEEFYSHAVRWYPKAGDAVIFNARLWHAGGENLTDRPRHALTINVCRAYMRQRFDYPRLVPDELVAKLGPVGRRFLGFNVRVPTSLDEYYVDPDKRLYLAGQG